MHTSDLISSDLAAFIASPVMMVVAARDSRFRAVIGRGSGAAFDAPTGLIDFYVCRAQWPDIVANLGPGARIATTYVRPTDYLSYQIKGIVEDVMPATEAEAARGRLYIERMLQVMETIEVRRTQLSHSLCARDLMRIGFHPSDVFLQSPGPGAGARVANGAIA